MQTAVAKKQEENKSSGPAIAPAAEHRVDLKTENAPRAAGTPIFLQRSAAAAPPPVQRQSDDEGAQLEPVEEEELLAQEIQPKLIVGPPNDEYEREADEVADRVQRMPDTGIANSLEEEDEELLGEQPETIQTKPLTPRYLQRMCAECEDELEQQGGASVPIQTKSEVSTGTVPSTHVSKTVSSPSGGGLLPGNVKAKAEHVLGQDLNHVRVHADSNAHLAARDLGAKAFTHQNHIWLGAGQSASDESLMAHEATHTVQQGGGGPRTRKPEVVANKYSGGGSPDIQAKRKWYEFSIPGTDYYFDPSIRGVRTAAGLVKKTAVAGAKAVGRGVLNKGKQAWKCAKATGRSILNIMTLDVSSIYDLLGIKKPSKEEPGAIDTIIDVINHPCLKMIPGYEVVLSVAGKLKGVAKLFRGILRVISNPSLVLDAIKQALGKLMKQIPSKVESVFKKVTSEGKLSTQHGAGIWKHLRPKLAFFAENWWWMIKETGKRMLMPWDYSAEHLSKIWSGVQSAADNIWQWTPKFSRAVDDLLSVWREINALAGLWYGLLAIAVILIATVLGAIFGLGGGAIPGFWAGVAVAKVGGVALLISYVSAEYLSISKALYDLMHEQQNPSQIDEDYEQVASSVLGLGITGVLVALSALAVNFARGVISYVRNLFRPPAPVIPLHPSGAPGAAPKTPGPPTTAARPGPTTGAGGPATEPVYVGPTVKATGTYGPQPAPKITPAPIEQPVPLPAPAPGKVIPFPGRAPGPSPVVRPPSALPMVAGPAAAAGRTAAGVATGQAPAPEPKPKPDEDEEKRAKECRVDWIGPLGGDPLASIFCEIMTGSPTVLEPRVTTPLGDIAWYDAKIGNTVFECKCGYLGTVRAYKKWQRTGDSRLWRARLRIEGPGGLDQQMLRNRRVARACGLSLRYYVSNKEVAEFLNARWGNDPVVLWTPWSECD